MLDMKLGELKNNASGFYNERMRESTVQIAWFFHSVAGSMVDMTTNLGFLIVIYFLNWQCGLFFSAGILLLFSVESVKIRKNTEYLAKRNDINAGITSKFNETYQGMKDIKGLGIKECLAEQNDGYQSLYQKTDIDMDTNFALLGKIKSFLQWSIDAALVLMCAFWLFPTDQITVVALLMIFNYKSNAYDTVGYLSKIKTYYMQGEMGAKKVLEIMDDSKAEKWGTENHKFSRADIRVENLSFSYDGKRDVLKDISFGVAPNSCSVFIGASGSGKSTLFGLLSKLLETSDGKIFIGGRDVNSFDEESFRRTVCIVNQEPFIFNDTVENNVKIVKPNAAREDVIAACKTVNIHNEIMNFQNGYDTLLSENGCNLSGGQKQRIAIARAVLKNTPVILFDEPTSALDKENQSMFFDVIKELKKSKTILIIAHKLNSYEIFDNTFILRNGKIERYIPLRKMY
jgi:ABC-type multidrug transport system fused ATPase/permease subunit